MRKPATIEKVYLDFDSFFASVEQQAQPRLRGRPVGVIPFPDAKHTCVIAASYEAKNMGVTTGMSVRDAHNICPDIQLVPQRPDLYVRAHHAINKTIQSILPIDEVCSIDEVLCTLDRIERKNPNTLADAINDRLEDAIGPYITCSIGFAPNHMLAKLAAELEKPKGITVLHPEDLPEKILHLDLQKIPGIGRRMARRLKRAHIYTIDQLWTTQPKQLRKLWNSVNGERLWYALHGYAIESHPTERCMFGHSRVLPPDWRDLEHARTCARLLLTKAARRMRRANFVAHGLWLSLRLTDTYWTSYADLPGVRDDQACLSGLSKLWSQMESELNKHTRVKRMSVGLFNIEPLSSYQPDLLTNDNVARQRWENMTDVLDTLNTRYGKTVVSIGPWTQLPGGYAGGKIAFTHVPDKQDFW